MIGEATSSPAVVLDLACRAEPDQWFDRDSRSRALRGCLECPARGWCAREALRTKAYWGMWAGVWIDGKHSDARGHLQEIADVPPTPLPRRGSRIPSDQAAPQGRYADAPAQALIAARSSGHCEVMLDGCRYTGDFMLSRITGARETDFPTAAYGFLACASCRSRLDQPGRIALHELGYRLHSPAELHTVAFFWRQARWVILDPSGRLDAPTNKRRLRAS